MCLATVKPAILLCLGHGNKLINVAVLLMNVNKRKTMNAVALYLYMDFIVKRIWYITVPTAMAVLVFQLYWLHNTYVNQQSSFKQNATSALQKAYDVAIVESVRGKNVKHKKTFVSSGAVKLSANVNLEDLKGAELEQLIKKLNIPNRKDTVITIENPDIDMSRFVSDVMSMTAITKPNLSVLNKNYRDELKNHGITLPFKLTTAKKGQANIDTAALISIAPPGKNETIKASFNGINEWLIFKIIWPILLSFLLVMLITGCIWVLWRIIHQQKKLELMKNDFISNISHELKTPLAILKTTNEVLLNFEGMKDLNKTERYLKLSKDELLKLQNLIDGILALTKLEHTDNLLGPSENVVIEDLLKAVITPFTELPGVHITYDLKISSKFIQTWPEALKTILSNLVDNAIKYTFVPQKIIKITVVENAKFYQLSVIDNGIGIAQHQQAFIFDKFYRVPQGNIHEVKGYGLGLSHVKSLVQKMDGQITLSSKLMEGSVFTIQIKKNGQRN